MLASPCMGAYDRTHPFSKCLRVSPPLRRWEVIPRSQTTNQVQIGGLWVQVSVVQFSNDVRVELSPQRMGMEQLRVLLGDMVRLAAHTHSVDGSRQTGRHGHV